MKFILITVIKVYRFFLSPLMGATCRFHPTCSAYMIEALEKHGAMQGALLGIKRVLKCHPFHKGHFDDPVPEGRQFKPLKVIATKAWFSYKLKKLNLLDKK